MIEKNCELIIARQSCGARLNIYTVVLVRLGPGGGSVCVWGGVTDGTLEAVMEDGGHVVCACVCASRWLTK